MSWNKKAGKVIGKEKAKEMIDKYQKTHKDGTRSVYFDMEMIKKLVSVTKAAGVAVFFAKGDTDENTVVLLPVDENGKVIFEDSSRAVAEDTAVNVGNPCPPYCTTSI